MLTALTRKFDLAPDVDLPEVAAACQPTLSGADLYALCADAWMCALKRRIADLEDAEGEEAAGQLPRGSSEGPPDERLVVCQVDFLEALSNLTPSLSREELGRYLALKAHYDSQQGFGAAAGAAAAMEAAEPSAAPPLLDPPSPPTPAVAVGVSSEPQAAGGSGGSSRPEYASGVGGSGTQPGPDAAGGSGSGSTGGGSGSAGGSGRSGGGGGRAAGGSGGGGGQRRSGNGGRRKQGGGPV